MTDTKKNWLIRTRDMQILGPISHKKILELLNNGSLHNEDEVCSGNGYWFFIREKDLVKKFIFDGVTQGFNPISEAKDVLKNLQDQELQSKSQIEKSKSEDEKKQSVEHIKTNMTTLAPEKSLLQEGAKVLNLVDDHGKLPSSEDLDYPDIDHEHSKESSSGSTQLGGDQSHATMVISEQLLKKLQR